MSWNADGISSYFASVLLALFIGCLCDMALPWCIKAEKISKTAHITMAVTAVFLALYGFSPQALRCILLCQVLIVAGVCDAVTREIPDCLHLFLAMVGLICFQPLPALIGFLLVPLPFLITALKTDKIGGGDVKLMAASGFALGVTGGIWMMILGLAAALLWNVAFGKGQKSLPLAPFLAIGGFMALLPIS
jgi:leader peptidase (prepilin peptidase)/N-methyltransferase